MRVARRNNGINPISRCRFCYNMYTDHHKTAWGKSLHFCDSVECRAALQRQVDIQKARLSRDAPDAWVENNPRRTALNNPALQWTSDFATLKVTVVEKGLGFTGISTKPRACKTFRREDVWRKDGLFTTAFTRFISEYLDPKFTITYSYNDGAPC